MPNDKEQRMFSIRIAEATAAMGIGLAAMILAGTLAPWGSAIPISPFILVVAVVLWLGGFFLAGHGWLRLGKLKKELK